MQIVCKQTSCLTKYQKKLVSQRNCYTDKVSIDWRCFARVTGTKAHRRHSDPTKFFFEAYQTGMRIMLITFVVLILQLNSRVLQQSQKHKTLLITEQRILMPPGCLLSSACSSSPSLYRNTPQHIQTWRWNTAIAWEVLLELPECCRIPTPSAISHVSRRKDGGQLGGAHSLMLPRGLLFFHFANAALLFHFPHLNLSGFTSS